MRILLVVFLLWCTLLIPSDAQQSTVHVKSTSQQPYSDVVACIHQIGFTNGSDFEWPSGYAYDNLFVARSGKRIDGATWTSPDQPRSIALRVALFEYVDAKEVEAIMTTVQSTKEYFKHYSFIWPFDDQHLIVVLGGCNLDKAKWRTLLMELDTLTSGSTNQRFTCECGGLCRTY
jgi:hypothetical protein